MRSLSAVLLVVLSACTLSVELGPETTLSAEGPTTSSSQGETTTTMVVTTATTAAGPVTTVEEAEAHALVTPAGVVVTVLEESAEGFLVRTPCGNEAVVSTGTRIGAVSVVIDPGHGGEIDTGAVGPNGLFERDLNLVVSQAVEAKLIVRGVSVVLTRTANYATTLGTRTALADAVGADLLLSVHHNAPTPGPSDRPGTEIFIQHDSANSRRLGGLVWRHVVQELSQFDIQWSAASDAGVLSVLSTRGEDAYGINRNPDTVSVLAEIGYISNRSEAELFATNVYVEAAAEALADAVVAYLNTDDPGSGFVEEPRVFNPQPGLGSAACVETILD